MSNILYADIETAPLLEKVNQMHTFKLEDVKYGNTKDPEKRQAIADDAERKFWAEKTDKAQLNPDTSEICAIGYVIAGNIDLHGFDGESEKNMLEAFWRMAFPDEDHNTIIFSKIAGWNFNKFDLKFLYKRSIYNGIKLPNHVMRNGRPNDRFVDLMDVHQFHEYKSFLSLDKACIANSIDVRESTGADNIGGKDFYKYLRGSDEDKELARGYLEDDMRQTHAIGTRLHNTVGF